MYYKSAEEILQWIDEQQNYVSPVDNNYDAGVLEILEELKHFIMGTKNERTISVD